MTKQDVLNSTARRIAQTLTADEIEREYNCTHYSGMDDDEILEFIGSGDPSEWLDMDGDEMTTLTAQAIEYINHDAAEAGRPGITCEPAELATDLMIYAAWQEAASK